MSTRKADPTQKATFEKRTVRELARRPSVRARPDVSSTVQRALYGPDQALDPARLLELQQAAGNQAVHRLLSARASELISQARGGGSPLPYPHSYLSRGREPGDGVKIHTDARADLLARSLGAAAFTSGRDIFFRRGQFDPHSQRGRKLLSHELAHVAQQGGHHSAYRLKLGREDDRFEREAEQVSRGPAWSHPAPQASSSASASVQRFRFPWQKHIPDSPNLTDESVAKKKDLGGGSLNEVSMITHKQPTRPGGDKLGFFKPNRDIDAQLNLREGVSHITEARKINPKEGSTMGAKAVASSRLNQWLGLDALAEETFAQYNGEVGSESARVEGKPLMEHEFKKLHPNQNPNVVMKDQSKWKEGARYQKSGTKFNKVDFSNPETQKGMSNIQILDAITAQRDRHGGNLYVDPKTGKTRGIDNDLAFNEGVRANITRMEGGHKNPQAFEEINRPSSDLKYLGMPTHIDEATAKSILSHKAKHLPKVLNSPDNPQQLSEEEVKETQERYRAIKKYVKDVKKGKIEGAQIVPSKGWGKETYESQVNAPLTREAFGKKLPSTYLQRSATDLKEAEAWGAKGHKGELKPTNPFETTSLQMGGHRFASIKPQTVPAPTPWHSGPHQMPESEVLPQPIQHQLTGIQHQIYEEAVPQVASHNAVVSHNVPEPEEMPKPQKAVLFS